MKFKIYLLLLCLLTSSILLDAQRQTNFLENPADQRVGYSCFSDGPLSYNIPVSGLPTSAWTLNYFHLNMQADLPDTWSVDIISPQGTRISIVNSYSGGLSNGTGLYFYKPCPQLPDHNEPPLENASGYWCQPAAGSLFPDLSQEDLNGNWTVEVCAQELVGTWWIGLDFTTVEPAIEFFDLNLATDCQSQSEIMKQITLPPCETGFTYKETNGYSIINNTITVIDFPFQNPVFNWLADYFPNVYEFELIGDNGGGVSTDYKVTPADYSTAGATINCPDDVTVNLGNHAINQPLFSRNCDVFVEMNLNIIKPDGTTELTIDPWNTYDWWAGIDVFHNYTESGTYQLNWTIDFESLENGSTYETTCTQNITISTNAITTFNSEICDDPNPTNVTNCVTVNNSQFHPIEVSGLPSVLSPEYSLRGVYLDLNISDFSTQLPYVDLVDPTGVRHRLFNPQSFPQFNGNTQSFKVFMAACNSGYNVSASDDVPFIENGNYRPMFDFNLNNVNLSGIDPNGTWQLQTCAGATWSINCFELDFSGTCFSLDNYSFAEENCQQFIQIDGSDISGGFCRDQNLDGVQDFFITIDNGNPVYWDPTNDNIKAAITPGSHTLSFARQYNDANGTPVISCLQDIQIDVPEVTLDSESPVFTECPSGQTLQIGSNNQTSFDITYPNASDNCGIAEEYLTVSYFDGTTDLNGLTMYTYTTLSGTTTFTVQGAGYAEFEYVAIDNNGNIGTCSFTMNFDNNDPCLNDVTKPVISNCPLNKTVQQTNMNVVDLNVEHPSAMDNCDVTNFLVTITYSDGAIDYNNNSGTFLIVPGNTYPYATEGTGKVTFDWEATDAAGNAVNCKTTVTVKGATGPCESDTQAPIFIDCPGDQVVLLDASGFTQFNLTDPDFSDNCTITSGLLVVTYMGGATDGQGGTGFTDTNLLPGTNFTYGLSGVGTVEFVYQVTDQAGNTAECVFVIASKEEAGPCANDVTNPTLTNCQSSSNVTLDNNNQAVFTVTAPTAADNCGIATTGVTVTYSGGATDENGDVTRNFVSFSNGAVRDFTIVGAGSVTLEFAVSDPSGNINSCATTITSNFGGTDVIFNIKEECIVAGATLSLPLRVTNFTNIGAFSFDLSVPSNSGLSFVGLENENINNVSYNVLANGDLRVSWDEPNGTDMTLENNYRIFNVVIAASASFATATTITGKDVVILQSGLPVAGRVDLATICVGSGVTPTGKIYSPLNKAHAGVKVNLVGGSNVIGDVNSDAQGNYSFAVTNNTFKITPTKNDEVRLGVGISDVARIRRHFLQTLFLDNDYKIVAADVNKDGKINVIDVAFTNRVFLKKLNEFPGNTAWRFIPVAADISKNPLNVNIPNQINLSTSGLDVNNLDFYSIKTGDVDHSGLNNFRGNSTGNRFDISISVPDTVVSPQNMVTIPVYLNGTDKVSALSFTMKYNTAIVELVSITAPSLKGFSAGSYNDIAGDVVIGWDHPQGEDVNAAGVLMMMTFASKVEEGMSTITIEDANVFDINLDEIGVSSQSGSVNFMTSSVNGINADYSIMATPNPFVNSVNIDVTTSTPQQLSLKFTDVSGKILKEITTNNKGANHSITVQDLEAKGVIIVLVEGDNFSKAIRLIKL